MDYNCFVIEIDFYKSSHICWGKRSYTGMNEIWIWK